MNPTEPKGITPLCDVCNKPLFWFNDLEYPQWKHVDRNPDNSPKCWGNPEPIEAGIPSIAKVATPEGIGDEADNKFESICRHCFRLIRCRVIPGEWWHVDTSDPFCVGGIHGVLAEPLAKNPTPDPLGEPTDKYPRDVAFQRILEGNAFPMSRREWFDEGWIACQSLGKSEVKGDSNAK